MRASDLFQPGDHVRCLDAYDLSAEIHGIVERLLDLARRWPADGQWVGTMTTYLPTRAPTLEGRK